MQAIVAFLKAMGLTPEKALKQEALCKALIRYVHC
jgi:hypothetical protein